MESHDDRPRTDHQESLGKSGEAQAIDLALSESNPEPLTAQTTQTVQGDRNQVIGSVSGGNVIGAVQTLNQYIQQPQPRFLSKHQLPPDIADFTGREQERETILTVLRQEHQQSIVAISGMAGAGKSALAIRAAHELKVELDEVQLYVNLRGAEDYQAVDPATVLVNWLRALGLDDTSIPAELEGRVAAYRSLLQDKRAIVLLDNAQHEDQIRPLLPGSSTCVVLITSRKKLVTLQGTTFLELSVLPEARALALLQTLIGSARTDAEPEPTKAILALCGRLPLAIRIAAGTLNKSSQQQQPLAEYVQKLQDEKQRLTQLNLDYLEEGLDVRTSFNLSYRELGDDLASLFCWLGLLEAPDFGVAVAAVLIEADGETARQRLNALIDTQLLEIVDEQRYRFHDLIRLFARENLEQTEPLEQQINAQKRVIQYFLDGSVFMNAILRPNQRSKIAESWVANNQTVPLEQVEQSLEQWALAWFEHERSTLLTLVGWITSTQIWEHLSRLSSNLALFLHRRSYWLDAEQLHCQALNATRQLGDRTGEAATLHNLGNVYYSQGKWTQAIKCHEQALQIKRALNDVHDEGLSLLDLGNVYHSRGKWIQALNCYEQALQICRTIDDVHAEGAILHNLGNVYYSQGKWSDAIARYEQALQICRAIGDAHSEGLSLNNLGNMCQIQGKWAEAITYYKQALQIKQVLGNVHGAGVTLNNLGNVYQFQGKWTEAINYYKQALQICRTIGDVHGEGLSLGNLGNVCRTQGKWAEAINCYKQALQICRALGDVHSEGLSLIGLGVVYQSQGKWGEAIQCYEQSLQINRVLGDVHGEGKTLMNLGCLHQKRGSFIRAVEHWQVALEKLHSDSSEYKRVYAWLHPSRQTLLFGIGMLLLGVVTLTFIVSNLLAGRWLVALVILLVTLVAWFALKAIQRSR